MKPLLVGEDNPYSADPRYALYPDPDQSAGGRLCRVILKMTRMEYLRTFDRVNLCDDQRWSMPVARARAALLREERRGGSLVLFGRKVAEAFGLGHVEPYKIVGECADMVTTAFFLLPHPSGRSRAWSEPWAVKRARDLLAPLIAEELGLDK